MKKITLLVAFMSVLSLTYAHNILLGCWSNGRYSITASKLTPGTTVNVKVDGTSYDTTIKITGTILYFSVPQSQSDKPVKVKLKFSDGYSWVDFTNKSVCVVTPLKWGAKKAVFITDDHIQVTATVYDVVNVDHITLRMSVDGKPFEVVGTVKPDNQADSKQYVFDIFLNKK